MGQPDYLRLVEQYYLEQIWPWFPAKQQGWIYSQQVML
jgi:hypothetical protein